MLKLLSEIDSHRELLGIMISRTLKIRYKRSALGFFWTLLNPLFFIIIYAVFLKILKFYRAGDTLFLPMLVTGVITWQFTAMCVNDSLGSILGNAHLVAKTTFPRVIFPLSMTVANLVNFFLSMLILLAYVLAIGLLGVAPIRFGYMGLLPVTLLTHVALCLGLALILSALNVFFRDTEHIVGVGMLAWFFLTPVIYDLSYIPEQYQKLAFLNPMTGIVTTYRAACLGGAIPAPRLVLMSFAIAWMVCLLGVLFFRRLEDRFVDEF